MEDELKTDEREADRVEVKKDEWENNVDEE